MLASSKCQRSWNHKERRFDVACCRVRCPQRIRSGAAMGTPLGTADAPTLQLVDGSDDHQTFADLDWLRIATRKSLHPVTWQCLEAAAKFLEQRRRIAARAARNFQFQPLAPGPVYDHELAESFCLESVFVRFNPMRFGCSAPQIHRKTGAGDEARTRDVHLGKVVLYQLSYTRSFERDNNVQPTTPRNLLIASECSKSLNPNRPFTASYD